MLLLFFYFLSAKSFFFLWVLVHIFSFLWLSTKVDIGVAKLSPSSNSNNLILFSIADIEHFKGTALEAKTGGQYHSWSGLSIVGTTKNSGMLYCRSKNILH